MTPRHPNRKTPRRRMKPLAGRRGQDKRRHAEGLDRQHWTADGTPKTKLGKAAAARFREAHPHLNVYHCPVCGAHHVGTLKGPPPR